MKDCKDGTGLSIRQAAGLMIEELDSRVFTRELIDELVPESLQEERINKQSGTELLVRVGLLTEGALDKFARFVGADNYREERASAKLVAAFLLPQAGEGEKIANRTFLKLRRNALFFYALLQMISSLLGIELRSDLVGNFQTQCNELPDTGESEWETARSPVIRRGRSRMRREVMG